MANIEIAGNTYATPAMDCFSLSSAFLDCYSSFLNFSFASLLDFKIDLPCSGEGDFLNTQMTFPEMVYLKLF